MDGGENVNVHTKHWSLQPESEYRFELDPGTTLAIKVRPLARLETPYVAVADTWRATSILTVPL